MTTKKKSPGRFKKLEDSEIVQVNSELLTQISINNQNEFYVPMELNPHGYVPQWKAVCYTCDRSLSRHWRNNRGQAIADERPHLKYHHWTDIVPRYIR